ncbi:MAG TPA: CocE/NonD family hydrolase [Ferruginibacter sp.]|nr:CocE/NonD family hydrolase [Ferruginibacter sp.]
MKKINCLAILLLLTGYLPAQERSTFRIKDFYNKMDTLIPMRDGVKLYTVIYTPKNDSALYPVLMERTPYSVSPYGSNNFGYQPAPNTDLLREGYILVLQDVRGRFMSEGKNLEVTPHIANKKSSKEVDESSDTYDTVDWLLKNIKNNNGRVGLYGISYPGFYATACLPGAHPAIKAVSPQAPIADEFMGDDANHNGAFFLLDNFNFMNNFGKERTEPVKDYGNNIFNAKIKDAYQFFLKLGPVKNTNSSNYFDNQSEIWNEYLSHDTYDTYWKARNIRPHLKDIRIPVMVVGGWYDAEDLFGALQTYKAIEKQSKVNNNRIVMGPWTHGGWATGNWTKFATQSFGSNTSKYFQDSLETAFFNFYLKDKGNFAAAEATMFETGSNQWKHYTAWPPAETKPTAYYFAAGGKLGEQKPGDLKSFSEYISDPAKPVPYTNGIYGRRNNEYMAEDQRFASTRPDVLVFETIELEEDLTLAGPITADLLVSITGTDADFIVKLVDVYPDSAITPRDAPRGTVMAGMQVLVRAEVMRGKFRHSFEKPAPFIPGKIERVKFDLNDVAHVFKKGHKIMVQVQSSWFPLVDRNPQQFLSIPKAEEKDFKKATIKIFHEAANASSIVLPVLK